MSSNQDSDELYKILELTKNATNEDIKSSYRKLSIKWHPDKNPTNREKATEIFQKISAAYGVLGDAKKKDTYDKFGIKGLQMLEQGIDPSSQSGFPFGSFMGNSFMGTNPFAAFFNQSSNRKQIAKCRPTIFKLKLGLPELYTGGSYKLNYPYKVSCTACENTGSSTKKREKCVSCGGAGRKVIRQSFGGGMTQISEAMCDACGGRGSSVDSKNKCAVCQGQTFVTQMKDCDFTVYPGMDWKMQIPVENSGDELEGMIPGDLIVVLMPDKENKDPTGSESEDDSDNEEQNWSKTDLPTNLSTDLPTDLPTDPTAKKPINPICFEGIQVLNGPRRNGADLFYQFNIPLVNSLIGLQFKIIHPGSNEVLIINHTEIIKPHSLYIIPNKGMPILDQNAIINNIPLNKLNMLYGKIIIEFNVTYPKKINEKMSKVLHALFGNGLNDIVELKNLKGTAVTLIPATNENKVTNDNINDGPQCVQQ